MRPRDDRIAALEALAEVQAEHGHIQELILQNFVPHPRYYGHEVAEIADAAAQRRWGLSPPVAGLGGRADAPDCGLRTPGWATQVTLEDMKRLIAEANG